jgi:hypothetical protein
MDEGLTMRTNRCTERRAKDAYGANAESVDRPRLTMMAQGKRSQLGQPKITMASLFSDSQL